MHSKQEMTSLSAVPTL